MANVAAMTSSSTSGYTVFLSVLYFRLNCKYIYIESERDRCPVEGAVLNHVAVVPGVVSTLPIRHVKLLWCLMHRSH